MKMRGPLCLAMMFAVVSCVWASGAAGPKRERASEFLARLSNYKTWTQVHRLDDDVSTRTFKITDSAIFAGG